MRYSFAKTCMAAAAACALIAAALLAQGARAPKLQLEEVGADSTAFDVVSTLIVGPTEVLLWDAQYHVSDATRLADRIAATGKHLKAIVISHPDHDHYMGTAVIVQRFPGTPVYMTAAALAEFKRTAFQSFGGERARNPAQTPDSLVTPQVLPSMHLTVDGDAIEVVPDLTGDVLAPTNSFLWIPSLRAALAADIVFNGVNPWLGSSDEASRAAWRQSVKKIADLHPAIVVAGHKKDVSAPDSPDVLTFMDHYLTDFDAFRKTSSSGQELFAAMKNKYPDLAVQGLLGYSAQVAFKK
jgi:glyoxylase-like metal-dependent hydrolase (beta-lactamase superfamily II)